MVVGHSDDGRKTRIRLPSGTRKTVPSTCRAVVGIVAGGGRMDKPMLKAGNNFHKYLVRSWYYYLSLLLVLLFVVVVVVVACCFVLFIRILF
ncbi:unnamed protein product [Polarella glacialis]|uniref:Large ribosomal subunit protein uL2 C-terminal domain-containing protein n=1 Tax=Polarella glacialis TaxID=89957 RepID=A0A813IXQ8_POLGL|nr:unnamed protein product [Polarella glacialis]